MLSGGACSVRSRLSARRGVAGVVAATACLAGLWAIAPAGAAAALPSNCSLAGADVICTFGYTGAAQTWTVPAGVTMASFDVQGAQGGGIDSSLNGPGGGGQAKADLAVTPGATVTLVVGGQGGSPPPCAGAGGGGFNGGAAGGSADFGCVAGAGGGGGASDVRIGGDGLADRVLVAGGGGGTSGGIGCGNGGGGGGRTGGAGTNGINPCGGTQGGGGDQTGASGSGQLGLGSGGVFLGGGGGGGYYGGAGSPDVGAGGGGSGFGPEGTTFATGVHGGNGTITISYPASPSDLAEALASDSIGQGPGSALADKAAAIQAAVNAGATASACAGVADYLHLVKAQTGKKRGPADPGLLTSEATNLAAALGC